MTERTHPAGRLGEHVARISHTDADAATYRVDPAQARRVAAAMLDAPRTSCDPLVAAAYTSLAAQAERWFHRLTGGSTPTAVRVVHTRCAEPYPSGAELARRVRAERILELHPAAYDRDRSHPLLDGSIGGALDRMRAVHDLVSHAGYGFGFDRDGEYSAWRHEDRLYTGLARWALATELHGEHSVVWTTGSPADHKATLLPRVLLAASLSTTARTPQARAQPR